MQTLVLIWLAALMPAGWILALITRSSAMFVPLTVLWIGAGISYARRVTISPCPRCNEKFCEKTGLPYWYGLFNRRCENCGLTLDPDRVEGD